MRNAGRSYVFLLAVALGLAQVARAQEVRPLNGDPVVERFLTDHKVYVSLTTSPQRISKIHNVLNTLDLTHVEKVLIALPRRFGRDNSAYEIPDWLIHYPKVEIIRTETDYGPATKLLPAAEYLRKTDPKSVVITVDDDIGYPRGMISELITGAAHFPGAAVGGSGQNLSTWGIPAKIRKPQVRFEGRVPVDMKAYQVDVLEGFFGVAYPTGAVNTEIVKSLAAGSKEALASDDLTISTAGLQIGRPPLGPTPRVMITSSYYNWNGIKIFQYGLGADALHLGAGVMDAPSAEDMNALKYGKAFAEISQQYDMERCLPRDNLAIVATQRSQPKREISTAPAVTDFLAKHRVYVSVTTSPQRLKYLPQVLDTLDLTYVSEVLVCLPRKFDRGGEYAIPEELRNDSKVKFVFSDKDYGPATSVISAVKYIGKHDPSNLLITIHDDTAYPYGMVSELILASVNNPGSAIAGSAQNLSFWGLQGTFPNPEPVSAATTSDQTLTPKDVLEGHAGVAYPIGAINERMIEELSDLSPATRTAPDLTVSLIGLGAQGSSGETPTPKLLVSSPYYNKEMVVQFDYGFGADALHRGAGYLPATDQSVVTDQKYRAALKVIEDLRNRREKRAREFIRCFENETTVTIHP